MKLANILWSGAPSDLLGSTSSNTREAFQLYSDHDHLKTFVLAFPTLDHQPPKRPAPSTV